MHARTHAQIMYAYLGTYIDICVGTNKRAHSHTSTHTHTCICMITRTSIDPYICTYVHTFYVRTYVRTCIHAFIHTNVHAYIHIYIHTYIHHTYIHTTRSGKKTMVKKRPVRTTERYPTSCVPMSNISLLWQHSTMQSRCSLNPLTGSTVTGQKEPQNGILTTVQLSSASANPKSWTQRSQPYTVKHRSVTSPHNAVPLLAKAKEGATPFCWKGLPSHVSHVRCCFTALIPNLEWLSGQFSSILNKNQQESPCCLWQ